MRKAGISVANHIFQSDYDNKYYFPTNWGTKEAPNILHFGPYDSYAEAEAGFENYKKMMWEIAQMSKGAKVVNQRMARITKRW